MKENLLKTLLTQLQDKFPLEKNPFKSLSIKYGVSESELIAYLRDLHKKGIIRHFGATINSSKLGYVTALCATHVPEERQSIAYEIADLPEITHAYLRAHFLNFWFTVVVKEERDLLEFVKNLEKKYDICIKIFPALKKFKAKAVFEL